MSCFYCTKSHNKIVIGKKTQVTLAKCSKNIHYVTKYGKTPTLHPCYWWTCYPKPMGIILLRERCCSTLLVSGCSSDVGTWLQEPRWSPTLMLGDTACCSCSSQRCWMRLKSGHVQAWPQQKQGKKFRLKQERVFSQLFLQSLEHIIF